MVPLQLMSISGKELRVSVLPLHVPERPFLGRGHPNGLGRGLRSLGLSPRRGRLGTTSSLRDWCGRRGFGRRGHGGRSRLRLRLSRLCRLLQPRDQGSEATGGSALSAISCKDYFIGRSPRKSQRKRWSRGY